MTIVAVLDDDAVLLLLVTIVAVLDGVGRKEGKEGKESALSSIYRQCSNPG